ncbi:Hypothetical predicted protein [Mytilus galloprovincialis]|uniref:Reelin domain-containing protein n=1 Tax=Mytilus galloprovincialis TaxID=29158 RepID=A0A8B6CV74_MYTGA|nr:Hypothetical predicted protein [Mytilus galloprovincialis]
MKMNKRKLLEVVLVVQNCLCLQHVTYGNHNGAPSSACDNMTPSHGPNPQQTSNSYTVTLNTTSYTYGTIVNVTLSSPVGTLFKGYMIQMRRIEDDTMVSGFYIDDGGQLLACNNVEYSTVTHTENGDKNTSSFLWSAPSDADGQLRIVGLYTRYRFNYGHVSIQNLRGLYTRYRFNYGHVSITLEDFIRGTDINMDMCLQIQNLRGLYTRYRFSYGHVSIQNLRGLYTSIEVQI